MELGPQFSPTQAADRRSRRRNLGPVTVGQNERGYTEQLPELVDAAGQQHTSDDSYFMRKDRERFQARVAAGKAMPQHPLEHKGYSLLAGQLHAVLGRHPTKADFREHFGVETNQEVKQHIRRHMGIED